MLRFDIPLHGLNCMGCARKVEKALVEQHKAVITDLSPHRVEFKSDSSFDEVNQSIEALSYRSGYHHHLSLSGLNCGKCVAKLEAALCEHPLVATFSANKTELTLHTALTQSDVIELVKQLGYQAQQWEETIEEEQHVAIDSSSSTYSEETSPEAQNIFTTHLLINGMTCASCVASVEKALLSVDGVTKAQINLAEQSALVMATRRSEELNAQLITSVTLAGYQAEIIEDLDVQQQKQIEQQEALKTHHKKNAWHGMLIGAPLMLWGVFGGNMMIRNSQDQFAWAIVGVVCLWLLATAGRSFFTNAWQALTHKRATMDTLVALGTGAAWLFSMLVVLVPSWFPASSRHVYFEASAMIVGLISLGHYIEAKAKAKTTQSLQALINLQPNEATVVTENGDAVISIKNITAGMMLRIKPGEKVPVDGTVVSGESYVDESMLTGEPIPCHKDKGQFVSAGTINQDGTLLIEANSVGSSTMLSRIISMVREAQSSKPAIAKLADQISSIFVPVVVAIALISAAIWYFVGPDPKASYMLVVATTVLIIACPCALGLATPLSVTVGVGKAAELGILIKDADVLQSASQINTVVFDKTGTLTQGKPTVQHVFATNNDSEWLLSLAGSLERHSEHPLAKAIVHEATSRNLQFEEVDNFQNLRGKGVTAQLKGQKLSAVSLPVAQQQGWDLTQCETSIVECNSKAWTPIIVSLDEQVLGLIAISDPIKEDAAAAIQALKSIQITPVMLTGDNHHVASAIANQLGIEQVISQVLPDEKAQHIADLQAQGKRVAMIGDGVNDAPALALADIGIAMGSGSDVAIESAQMTLLNSSPFAVVNAIELSKATVKNMKQNLFGAFVYNSLGIPVAAGVLYPAFGFLLSPVVAGVAMAMSSITVVSNANRLRLFKASSRL
ncbi:copper-translocating P-type ATPase [Vibrio sp. NH-7]